MTKETVVAAMRKSQLKQPYVPSRSGVCLACGEEVWLANSVSTAPARLRAICIECIPLGAPVEIAPMLPAQQAEIEHWLKIFSSKRN